MSKEYDLNLKLGVEAFGTFALITTAMASKGHPAVNSSLLVILIIGLAGVSGGPWNPAATIANIINKSIDQNWRLLHCCPARRCRRRCLLLPEDFQRARP